MKKLVLVLLIALGSASIAAADTIYLRGGSSLRGNVLGFINGRFAIQLTSNATIPANPNSRSGQSNTPRAVSAGDVIFLRPRDIERIEIDGRSLDDARYQSRSVDVTLGSDWIDSGVDLKRGERVRVDASGIINIGRRRIGPAGLNTTDPSAPLPQAAEGKLIGVVGNDYDSPIIELGSSREFAAERDGRLYLTPNMTPNTTRNTSDGFYGSGVYKVQVRKEVDLSAMARADSNRNQNDDSYDPFGFPDESGSGQAQRRPRQPGNNPNSGGRRNNRTLEKVVDVPGNQPRGIDTGIELRTGDQVTITATGNVTAGRRAGVVSPDGGRQGAAGILGASTYPVPTAGVGALIGYIVSNNGQTSQPFLVGSQATFTTPVDGRLYLTANDDNYSDNSGSFSARIVYPDYRQ
ncbi:MAG: LecA/PA-IL family lectin [Pyrinomonadaceae bacterium]